MAAETWYSITADAILLLHFAFVAFVALGLPAVWIGYFLRQRWAYGIRWRIAHLAAMAVVVVESVFDVVCPLTTWENDLRWAAGDGVAYEESFMQTWIHKVMFFEASPTTFLVIYCVFFALLVLSWIVVRPRRRLRVTGTGRR